MLAIDKRAVIFYVTIFGHLYRLEARNRDTLKPILKANHINSLTDRGTGRQTNIQLQLQPASQTKQHY